MVDLIGYDEFTQKIIQISTMKLSAGERLKAHLQAIQELSEKNNLNFNELLYGALSKTKLPTDTTYFLKERIDQED